MIDNPAGIRCDLCYYWDCQGTDSPIGDCRMAQQSLTPIIAYCRDDEFHNAIIETVASFFCKEWRKND